MSQPEQIEKIAPGIWQISKLYKERMRVPACIFTSEKLLNEMDDGVFDQVTNVARLPGIQNYLYCMSDGHWEYGFPIGGIGFDINCGSRGFGHQIGTDYLKAFVNRQLILHRIRESFARTAKEMQMSMVYDVAHNVAKIEEYEVGGIRKKLMVHRKGATRAFGPNHPELHTRYGLYGQPVILGVSMETGSYLLVGTKEAEEKAFGSTAHGSARTMSRHAAKKKVKGSELQKDMEKHGIYVESASKSGLAEEAGFAYKNIDEVVESLELSGISKKVASFKPIGNIKG